MYANIRYNMSQHNGMDYLKKCYQITRCHTPEDGDHHNECAENLIITRCSECANTLIPHTSSTKYLLTINLTFKKFVWCM